MSETTEQKASRFPISASGATSLFVTMISGLSVAHEWGYFNVIGRRWITLLDLSDYVSLAVEWMPMSIGATVVIMAVALLLPRPELKWIPLPAVTPENIEVLVKAHEQQVDENIRTLRRHLLYTTATFAFLLAVLWLLIPPGYFVVEFFGGTILCFCVAMWVASSRESLARKKSESILMVGMIAGVMLASAGIGGFNGLIDLDKPSLSVELIFEDETSTLKVGVFRNLRNGILVDNAGQTEFHRWDNVKALKSIRKPYNDNGRICNFVKLEVCSAR